MSRISFDPCLIGTLETFSIKRGTNDTCRLKDGWIGEWALGVWGWMYVCMDGL